MTVSLLLIAVAAFVLSTMLTGITLRVLRHYQIMDNPNLRSSHTVRTPRGGGWGIMLALLLVVPALALFHQVSASMTTPLLWLAGGVLLLMVVSWLDDVRDISAKARFFVQFLAVLCGLQALPDGLVLQGFLPAWAEQALMALGWLWFINLYNFMDGIDGITGQQTAFMGVGVALVALLALPADALSPWLGMALVGAALGFLVWNWHPAKLFMGDIGSVPLGFVVGFLLLALAVQGQLVPALILPLYYVGDATFTLLKRALKGERIWEPHRQHFYQQALAVVNKDHHKVVALIMACNLLLLLCALAAIQAEWLALLPAKAAVIALFLVLRRRGILTRQALPPR